MFAGVSRRREMSTAEHRARELLDRMEVPKALDYSAGELVELANLIRVRDKLELRLAAAELTIDDMRAKLARLRAERLAQSRPHGVWSWVPWCIGLAAGIFVGFAVRGMWS